MTSPLVYHVRQKMPWVLESMAIGAHADMAPAKSALQRDRVCIIGGLQYGSLELMREAAATGFKRYLFVDAAYFGGGKGRRRNRFRVVPGAYLQNWTEGDPPDRWNALGIEMKPWRDGGRWIVVCPPSSPAVETLFGAEGWLAKTLDTLGQHTDRPIRVRRKGDVEPLAVALEDAHAVVTFQSNVAVDAVLAGVPVFVDPINAAAPVGRLDLSKIEEPLKGDREPWAWSLAYGQFTLREMEQGLAWRIGFEKLKRRIRRGLT